MIGLKGPLASPRRSIDISALAGWLALRAVDQQSKKLEQIEAERSGRTLPPASPVLPAHVPSASSAPPAAPKAAAPLPPPLEIKPVPRAAPAMPQRPSSSLTDRDRFFNLQR
jgi:large subunit ribosomal protein L24